MKDKKLPTLYKVDIKGNIRHWTVAIKDASFYTEAGIVGDDYKVMKSKATKTVEKNVNKKNYISAEDQAGEEAKRKWVARKTEGFYGTIEEAVKADNKKPHFAPMLAEKYTEKLIEDSFPVMVQAKLDGIRCIVQKENDKLVARSRNGKEFDTLKLILDDLIPLFDEYPNLILDGELYNHNLKEDFNKIISLVRKKKPANISKAWMDILEETKEKIQYHIYDIPQVNGPEDMDTEYWTRTVEFVHELKTTDLWPDNLRLVQTWWCDDAERVSQIYDHHVNGGYEGSMIRLNKGYETSRSKSLLKYKEFKDAEYLVIGIDEGDGNRSGTAKHLVCKDVDSGKVFNSNIKGSFEWYAELLENKDDYIGKMVTIQFANLTPDGIPRFPFALAFRDYE